MREAATEIAGRGGRLSSLRSVVVFRALNLGDMLCAVPALRALRAGLPAAHIALVGLPRFRFFETRFGKYIDEFIDFPGYPGLPEQQFERDRVEAFFESIRLRTFDFAIQMHGSGRVTNALVASLGARMTAGFYPPGFPCPDPERFVPYPKTISEVERSLSLMVHLGFDAHGKDLEFPVHQEDRAALLSSADLRALKTERYVCLHPGASVREKCWPAGNFGLVGRWLKQAGFTIVVTGNRAESDLAARITEIVGEGCIDAASLDLDLGSLAVLIRDARLLVCNDTGVSHLASALRAPSVVIFSRSDLVRWAPLDSVRHRSVGEEGKPPSVDEVLNAVQRMF